MRNLHQKVYEFVPSKTIRLRKSAKATAKFYLLLTESCYLKKLHIILSIMKSFQQFVGKTFPIRSSYFRRTLITFHPSRRNVM